MAASRGIRQVPYPLLMRLFGNIPCGCEEREEIIFRAGHLSWVEGAILAFAAAAIVLAFTLRNTTHA